MYYIVWLVDVDWIEVGLKYLYAEIMFGSQRSKSVEKLPNFPLAGLELVSKQQWL